MTTASDLANIQAELGFIATNIASLINETTGSVQSTARWIQNATTAAQKYAEGLATELAPHQK